MAASDPPSPDPAEEPPVLLPIEDSLDLHTFAPRDIPDLVQEYLAACARQGLLEVRLIHGRGTGTQRQIVRSVLAKHPLVRAFSDAPPERGGWGATLVQLSPTEDDR
jgi:DNA-nicking Smr family endonuclease